MSLVLITGAAGYLGGLLRTALKSGPYAIRLSDLAPLPRSLDSGEQFVQSDLTDADAVRSLCRDVHTVVHLGGHSVEAPWDIILHDNIVGTYMLFEAARIAGVRRVIYASSHHVVGFYRRERVVGVGDPPRPDSRYAVSKSFGETLGRLYADKYGIDVICLRLGIVRQTPPNVRALSAWLSEPDFVRLCVAALSAPPVHYLIVYGGSANGTSFWSNDAACRIGFSARDDAMSAMSPSERSQLTDDPSDIERAFQGGWFCGMEFNSDPSRID